MSSPSWAWIISALLVILIYGLLFNIAIGLAWNLYNGILGLLKIEREDLTWRQATSTGVMYASTVLLITSLTPDPWEDTKLFHILGVLGISAIMGAAVSQRKVNDKYLPPFHWAEMVAVTVYMYFVAETVGPHLIPTAEFVLQRIGG